MPGRARSWRIENSKAQTCTATIEDSAAAINVLTKTSIHLFLDLERSCYHGKKYATWGMPNTVIGLNCFKEMSGVPGLGAIPGLQRIGSQKQPINERLGARHRGMLSPTQNPAFRLLDAVQPEP